MTIQVLNTTSDNILDYQSNRSSKVKFTFIDLFAGIGGFHIAASSLGGKCLFASELDIFAKESYEANYGIYPSGDITKIKAKDIPDHDVLFAGFPCQPFSIIGNRMGFNDIRGTLFFDIARILKQKKPTLFILENVKQLSTHNKGKTLQAILDKLEGLKYTVYWSVLNALDYSLPQKRERVVFVGFKSCHIPFSFPKKMKKNPIAKILENEEYVDPKYFANKVIVEKRKRIHTSQYTPSVWHENKSGNISSYPYSCALRASASYNYLLVDGKRRLTPREQLRLQGFPDSFKIICNDAQTRKQTGNAVPVPMIRAVLRKALKCLNQN